MVLVGRSRVRFPPSVADFFYIIFLLILWYWEENELNLLNE